MTHLWLWVCVALCAVGAILAGIGIVIAFVQGLRVARRAFALSRSPFITRLESFQLQAQRFNTISTETESLLGRANAAIASIRESAKDFALTEARAAIAAASRETRLLVEELR